MLLQKQRKSARRCEAHVGVEMGLGLPHHSWHCMVQVGLHAGIPHDACGREDPRASARGTARTGA